MLIIFVILYHLSPINADHVSTTFGIFFFSHGIFWPVIRSPWVGNVKSSYFKCLLCIASKHIDNCASRKKYLKKKGLPHRPLKIVPYSGKAPPPSSYMYNDVLTIVKWPEKRYKVQFLHEFFSNFSTSHPFSSFQHYFLLQKYYIWSYFVSYGCFLGNSLLMSLLPFAGVVPKHDNK